MKENKTLNYLPLAAGISILLVFGAYILWFSFCLHASISQSPSDWGTFGDFIGGILNPILTFITIIALYFSLRYQIKEVQQAEIEINESQRNIVSQYEAQKKTSFETSFYNMINMHHELIKSYAQGSKEGSQYFKEKLSEAVLNYRNGKKENPFASLDSRMYRHPFILSHIFNLVESASFLSRTEKDIYIDILRSNLSQELIEYCKEVNDLNEYSKIQSAMSKIGNDA